MRICLLLFSVFVCYLSTTAQVRELADPKVSVTNINTKKSFRALSFIDTEFS